MLVQALPHFQVGIAQPVAGQAILVVFAQNRQVAGLEQQGLDGHFIHVEGGKQRLRAGHALQIQAGDAATQQGVDQESRRAGLEPVGLEAARPEQKQNVEGVVKPFFAQPAVAVVPAAYLPAVQAGQFRGEHDVQVAVRVAADGRVARVQREIFEIVEAGEDADLGKFAHPRQQRELDVRIAVLDDGVQAAQEIAVGAGHLRRIQRIQNWLVAFIHQHRHSTPGALVQRFDQVGEALRGRRIGGTQAGLPFRPVQLRGKADVQMVCLGEVPPPEADPQHGAGRPVPLIVDGQPPEQFLAALEEFLDGVQQQALAEAPGAGQEIMPALVHQLPDMGGLVHIVAALLTDQPEGLDADGQLAPGSAVFGDAHGRTIIFCLHYCNNRPPTARKAAPTPSPRTAPNGSCRAAFAPCGSAWPALHVSE